MDTLQDTPQIIRPDVAMKSSSRGLWLFAGCAALGAMGLFFTLEARRTASSQPAITAMGAEGARAQSSIPPLDIPAEDGYAYGGDSFYRAYAARNAPRGDFASVPMASTAPQYVKPGQLPQRQAQYAENDFPTPKFPSRLMDRGGYVAQFEGNPLYGGRPFPQESLASKSVKNDDPENRVLAGRLANPAFTIPKGAIIQAVLETALDSSRPGMVRAIVTRDVRGFDGSRVLIMRGSRLVGEYSSDLAQGDERAVVTWKRLVRTDGVTIDLSSPAADPLGRNGIKGKVNSHFFQRFGNGLLQSIFNIGTQAASTAIAGRTGVYVMLPPFGMGGGGAGAQSQAGADIGGGKIAGPTVKVKHGTSTSVFVFKDLDFSSVDQ